MARWFYNRPSEKCDETEIKAANKLRRLSKRWTIRWGFYYVDNKGNRREGDFLIFAPLTDTNPACTSAQLVPRFHFGQS